MNAVATARSTGPWQMFAREKGPSLLVARRQCPRCVGDWGRAVIGPVRLAAHPAQRQLTGPGHSSPTVAIEFRRRRIVCPGRLSALVDGWRLVRTPLAAFLIALCDACIAQRHASRTRFNKLDRATECCSNSVCHRQWVSWPSTSRELDSSSATRPELATTS
jgi:hypothetical protein